MINEIVYDVYSGSTLPHPWKNPYDEIFHDPWDDRPEPEDDDEGDEW